MEDELSAHLEGPEGDEQLVFELVQRDEIDWLKNLFKLPSAQVDDYRDSDETC